VPRLRHPFVQAKRSVNAFLQISEAVKNLG
jgi:hypothetical protein